MLELDIMAGGFNTPHYRGYTFTKEDGHDYWLFMCFRTPFYFELDGRREGGIGGCLLQPPGTPLHHGPLESMTEGFVNDWFYFGGADAAPLVEQLELPINEIFSVGDTTLIQRRIEALIHEREQMLTGTETMQACCIAEILIELRRGLMPGKSTNDAVYRIMSEARSHILANAGESWTLEQMAKLAGYSTSRFTMLYRRFFDSSPTSDLIRTRVMNARNLLLYSEHSISRISELCGFSSLQYFTRTYKAITGVSPSRVRRPRG